MAPLPTSLDPETQDLIASAQRRLKDLSEFQIPRLKSCPGPLSLQQSLAAELRDDIESFSQQVVTLDLLVDDQYGDKNRNELRQIVREFQSALLSLRKDSRAALLSSKKAIDSQNRSRRAELLNTSSINEKQSNTNEKATDDPLMKANDDLTEALRRTVALMQGELERSVLSTQMLESSTATLKAASTQHDVLSSVMFTSKQLVTALEKTDWLDRVLIVTAFIFFLLVVLFILKQRFVDRGLRMALWWTRFIPSFSGDEALLAMKNSDAEVALPVSESGSLETAVASTLTAVASMISSASTLLHSSDILETAGTTSEALEGLSSITTLPSMSTMSSVLSEEMQVAEGSAAGESSTILSSAQVDPLEQTEGTTETLVHVEL